MKIILTFILSLIILSSCTSPTDSTPADIDIKEKIGQMLLVGFRGLQVNDSSTISKDIRNGRVGGVILFDRDVALASNRRNIKSPDQVKSLVSYLHSISPGKLFVAIDQEGGKITRLKEKYGFPSSVSQQYLGQINNYDSTYFYGERTAKTLSDLGINLNFAPVTDLNINPQSPAIGALERSFSADPQIVTDNALAIINAHHKYHIRCSLKHFPGHGSAGSDSHLGITDITNTWQEIELDPYKNIINANKADFIMTAHVFNSNLDPNYPATLSDDIINGILRDQLGYDGVVISDDMTMKAITDQYGFETAIELAINAGVDIFIFGNNLVYDEHLAENVIEIILKLIEEEKVSASRINESYQRIIKLKNSAIN